MSHVLPTPTEGPGKQLKLLLGSMGLKPNHCACERRMDEMNAWGLEGCRRPERREEILGWLRIEQARLGWLQKIKAGALAALSGLALTVNPLDPAPGLLDEALRREEDRLSRLAAVTPQQPTSATSEPSPPPPPAPDPSAGSASPPVQEPLAARTEGTGEMVETAP